MKKERLAPGTLLDGRFKVQRLIKAGGMGAVYEVSDRVLNDRVFALKEMTDLASDPTERVATRDRFISEIQVMLSLHHPNIPRVTAQFIHENSFFFVMEFIEGKDLSQILKEEGAPGLDASRVISWALQVLDALEYLHGQNPPVVHRDIKSSNILLGVRDGRVRLIDFGVSRVVNPAEGYWMGSSGYAPPEQQAGRHEPRSDLYALGATMHELLSGRRPQDFDFPQFSSLGVKVDPHLSDIVFDALKDWPDERIQSAREMADRLRGLEHIGFHLPSAGRDHDFEAAVRRLKQEVLDPLLQDLIQRYRNECHTPHVPKSLDFLQFTLACPTPFELQVVKDADREEVRFLEKQGLLDPHLLGTVRPLEDDPSRVRQIVQQFVENYEQFKSTNWQLGTF
ncbi:MAG: serine/threonine-protein kinase [Candidatus Eremiobacterota bacterium]